MGVQGGDPWVQLTDTCAEFVANDLKRLGQWNRKFGASPQKARSITFGRLGAGSQKGAELYKYCAPSGAIRPGIDPLPHHYGIPQNHKVLRANLQQHIGAMEVPTKPKEEYDQRRDTSFMSITEMMDKDSDFMYRTPNRLFNTQRHLPTRQRRAKVEAQAAATLASLPRELIEPPTTGRSRSAHGFMTDSLLKSRETLTNHLQAIEEQLMDEPDEPSVSEPGTQRTRRSSQRSSRVDGAIKLREGPFGDLIRANRSGPFATPDRNQITLKDGSGWKERFDEVMKGAEKLYKQRQFESRRKAAEAYATDTPERRISAPEKPFSRSPEPSLVPLC